jgi:hypothetical protein
MGRTGFEQELNGQQHVWSIAADVSDRKQPPRMSY